MLTAQQLQGFLTDALFDDLGSSVFRVCYAPPEVFNHRLLTLAPADHKGPGGVPCFLDHARSTWTVTCEPDEEHPDGVIPGVNVFLSSELIGQAQVNGQQVLVFGHGNA